MFKSPSWFSAYIKHFVFGWFSATPIKFLDLAGGLAVNCSYFFTIFNEEAPIYWKLGRGGPILMAFWKRRHHFIGQIWEEAGEVFFFIYVENDSGCWQKLHSTVHALHGELVVWIELLYQCGLIFYFNFMFNFSSIPQCSWLNFMRSVCYQNFIHSQ